MGEHSLPPILFPTMQLLLIVHALISLELLQQFILSTWVNIIWNSGLTSSPFVLWMNEHYYLETTLKREAMTEYCFIPRTWLLHMCVHVCIYMQHNQLSNAQIVLEVCNYRCRLEIFAYIFQLKNCLELWFYVSRCNNVRHELFVVYITWDSNHVTICT